MEFPKIELFPRVEKVAAFIKGLFTLFPEGTPAYMSDHYHKDPHPFDAELYDQPEYVAPGSYYFKGDVDPVKALEKRLHG